MTVSRELLAFAKYIRERMGKVKSNELPLHGMLDGYGLTGPDKDDMIAQLHKIGAVRGEHVNSFLVVNKLPEA